MAKQTVNVGTSASDGTGDELRVAFTKINENFTELYSGNVQVTASNVLVHSVAGRTGNIVLTVNDVAQAASKSYVNNSISANLANVTGSITNSLSANITAANAVIATHSTRITALESNVSTNLTDIDALQSGKADISFVYNVVEQYVSANAVLGNVTSVNANVAAANLAIAALQSNSATISNSLNIISGNVNTYNSQFNSINANVSAANAQIASLTVSVNNFDGDFGSLQTNAASQSVEINSLRANITAANAAMTAANTIQRLDIQSLQSDTAQIILSLGTLGLRLDDLVTSNLQTTANLGAYQTWSNAYAASQNVAINSLRANITAANAAITPLQTLPSTVAALESNAATQGSLLNSLTANAGTQATLITGLTANAASQALEITGIETALGVQYDTLTGLTANAASQAVVLNTLTSNAVAQALEINSLRSNIGSYVGNLAIINANLGAYQTYTNANIGAFQVFSNAYISSQNSLFDSLSANLGAISTTANTAYDIKANIAGQIFTGNITAPYVLANTSVKVSGIIEVGNAAANSYPNSGGTFTGNVNSPYRVVLQNINDGNAATSEIVLISNDGTLSNNRMSIGINSNNMTGTHTLPRWGSTTLEKFPHDGTISVNGGNLALWSDQTVFLVANTAIAGLLPDGTFYTRQLILDGAASFSDMTVSGGMSSTSGVALLLEGNDVNLVGNIKISGGAIHSDSDDNVIKLVGPDVVISNQLTVGGVYTNNLAYSGNIVITANSTRFTFAQEGNLVLNDANLKFRDGTVQQTAIEDVPGLFANIGTLFQGNITTNSNLGTLFLGNISTNANLGAYQTFANANAAVQTININTINANLGTYQNYANANVVAIQANLGAFQTFSNANAAAQAIFINTLNSNVSAANAAIQTLSANIGTLVGGAGAALDTLLELGNALGNSDSFSSTVVNWLSNITANITAANSAITTIDANIGSFYNYANANIGTLFLGNISTNANLGAYQLYANANIAAIEANIGSYATYANANIAAVQANIGSFYIYANANIGTLFLGNTSTNANLGAFQLYANANIGTLFLGNTSTNANLGAYQTYANSTVAAIQANLGAYQTYANANAATQTTTIDTLLTQVYSNANVTAYLVTYSGNIAVGNIQITGNINYTPNTAGNYNQTITNMQLALDELAARVKALGG